MVSSLNEKVLETYRLKKYEECLELIKDSLKENPESTQLTILQTSCWTFLNKNRPETYAKLEEVMKKEPKNSFAAYGFGLLHYYDAELKESIKYLNRAIELNPTNTMQKAVEVKQKAVKILEAIDDANKKFESNEILKALRALQTALIMDSENKKVHENILALRQTFINKTVKQLENEVERDIKEIEAKALLDKKVEEAQTFIDCEMFDEAEKTIEEISKLIGEDSEQVKLLKGAALYKSGSVEKAIPMLSDALQLNPNNPIAKELHEKAVLLNTYIVTAAAKMVERDHVESINLLTKALTVDKNNKKINQATYFQRAMAHFSLGNSSEAYADFKSFEALQEGTNLKNDVKIENIL